MERVDTAPCGCGIFDTGGGLAKVHDDNCEWAPKKPEPRKKPHVHEEPKKAPAKKK